MVDRKFTKVEESEFIKLGENNVNSVEGTLINKEQIPMRNNMAGKYTFQRDDETIFQILGSTQLDDLMMGIETGTYVRVTLKPETEWTKTSSGNVMKAFLVETA